MNKWKGEMQRRKKSPERLHGNDLLSVCWLFISASEMKQFISFWVRKLKSHVSTAGTFWGTHVSTAGTRVQNKSWGFWVHSDRLVVHREVDLLSKISNIKVWKSSVWSRGGSWRGLKLRSGFGVSAVLPGTLLLKFHLYLLHWMTWILHVM